MKKVTSILLLLLLCFPAYSQNGSETKQKSEKIEIYFDQDSYAIDSSYRDNWQRLNDLDTLFAQLLNDSLVKISEVQINSYSSPEGRTSYNTKLSEGRTTVISSYLTARYPLAGVSISKNYSGADWVGLTTMVEQSDMLYKDEVLDIVGDIDAESSSVDNIDSCIRELKALRGGVPYSYINDNFFPVLRRSSILTVYYESLAPECDEKVVESKEEEIAINQVVDSVESSQSVESSASQVKLAESDNSFRFAIKTNLLYDLCLSPNFELEFPIGDKFSIAGEWIFPWWVTNDNGNALQVLSAQLEGRYWFNQEIGKPQLTGWFAGLYAGGGLYDLQWQDNGYQGEFYITAGLSGGYAHTINKSGSLRMEYSLGVGYLNTNYRYYEGRQDNEYLVWQHDGKYSWVGPTKLEVSLVWMIDWKKGGKR